MNLDAAMQAARQGRLYPSVILHGGDDGTRRAAALDLARTLLCEAAPDERPCGHCRHCRRMVGAGRTAKGDEAPFHPDFQILERDLKASTSVDATRELMRGAQVSPFEARGQVFVVASAESLTGEAANALLKGLEEPHLTAPRHFLLLTPSRLDLLPTLRSRSLAVFLGPSVAADPQRVAALASAFGAAADAWSRTRAAVYLLGAAAALAGAGAAAAGGKSAGAAAAGKGAGGGRGAAGAASATSGAAEGASWDDPRSGRPWALAAAAVLRSNAGNGAEGANGANAGVGEVGEGAARGQRAARLALAEALLGGPSMRMRGISAERILEGLVARHLAGIGPGGGAEGP
jgi:hypothetical protein